MPKRLIALLGAASLAIVALAGQELGDRVNMAGLRESETREFLAQFQEAVRSGDSRRVAKLIRFPALVAIDGESDYVSRKEFLLKYDRIMTQDLVTAILKAKFEELIINSYGVGLPAGIVWFCGRCSDAACQDHTIRITTINGLEVRKVALLTRGLTTG